jgi:hypothetical protein
MIDKRSLLLGLGIGLIAGALALQLMLAGKEQNRRLADIGRLSGEEALYTQSEVDEMIAEAEDRIRRQLSLESPGAPGDAGTGGPEPDPEGAAVIAGAGGADGAAGVAPEGTTGGTPDDGGSGDDDGNAEAGQASADAHAEGAGEAVRVRIRPGMSLTQTAKLLESEGVIEDADALIERMARMSTKIRAGYYTFTGSETLEEVQTMITRPPED